MNINNFNFNEILKLFPEIKELENIDQNPKYHKEGNVLIHTRNVCNGIVNLDEWKDLSNNEKFILYIAGAFHDIGKLVCTKVEDGEIVSPKHAVIGTKIFRELIYKNYGEKYNIDFNTRESIANLIRYHGLPLLFMDKHDIDYEVIKASECVDMKLLYLLAKADLLGRECSDKADLISNIDCFKEYAIELGCYYNKKEFANSYSRFLYLNNNSIWHRDEVFDSRKFKVIVMVGIPLSGKDSFIEEHYKELPVISLDNIRDELKISPKEGSKKIVTIAKERAKKLLRKKQSFVWNATNIMKDTRKSLCKLFSDYGAAVEYVYVEVPYSEILERYEKRDRVVPMKVIDKMIKKMDMVEEWEGNKVSRFIGK